jgi:hypothetical protein
VLFPSVKKVFIFVAILAAIPIMVGRSGIGAITRVNG